MKWLLFLLLLIFSCKAKKKSPGGEPSEDMISNSTLTPSGLGPEMDSGYFKGYLPEKIDGFKERKSTHLDQFLSDLIRKKDLLLLNKETLSHSVFINQKIKTRFDTLKNNQATIISKFEFGDTESQIITINDVVVKNYRQIREDSTDDVINLDENTFRDFSFRGKEFYYIQGHSFYSHQGSIGNVCYHFIYDLVNKQLRIFQTCRFEQMLFGDVNGDNDLDYLDFDNSDFCTAVPNSDNVAIQLYSCNSKGNFILQKDSKGKPYYIEGDTGKRYTQDSFIVKKSYWPFSLK